MLAANRGRIVEVVLVLAAVGALAFNLEHAGLSFNSRMWPLVILCLMAGVALTLLPAALTASPEADAVKAKPQEAAAQADSSSHLKRYGMMAVYSAFVLALPYLGFALATMIFVPVAARMLGMPLRLKYIALSLVMAISIYLLFATAFNVPLPEGLLVNLDRWL